MRILVIISPTNKWGTKTSYTKFRKFLSSDGYLRIAPEVYMRVVQNRKAAQKHYRRMDEVIPRTGTIRVLRITEKQFASIYTPVKERDFQEEKVGAKSQVML